MFRILDGISREKKSPVTVVSCNKNHVQLAILIMSPLCVAGVNIMCYTQQQVCTISIMTSQISFLGLISGKKRSCALLSGPPLRRG